MKNIRRPSTLLVACRAARKYGVAELYAVFGDNFVASVQVSGDPVSPRTYKARSGALARALEMQLTTVPCV